MPVKQFDPGSLFGLAALAAKNDFWARMLGGVGPDYDYSFVRQGPDGRGHFTDAGKLPNHPTFSNQSAYADEAPLQAGRWVQLGLNQLGYQPGMARQGNKAYMDFMLNRYLPVADPNVSLLNMLGQVIQKGR
jgi:hypothetical protein